MTKWSERFEDGDGDLNGRAGFVVVNDGTTPLGGITILSSYATPLVSDAAVVAVQTANTPETIEQEIRVIFASTDDAPVSGMRDYWILAGVYDPAGLGSSWGNAVKFTFEEDGTRTLEIIQESNVGGGGILFGSSPDAILVTTKVIAAVADISGLGDTDLLVTQQMRLIVTQIDGGIKLRAYFNEDDDDKPTLEYDDYHDAFEFVGSGNGNWFFGFGPSQAGHLKLQEIHAKDYEEKLVEAVQLRDRFTLKEIRDHVLTRVDGSSTGTDRAGNEPFMNELINATVEEILDLVGDVALFMQPVEEMVFEKDANGYAIAPAYVEKIMEIYDAGLNQRAPYRFIGYTANEQVEIQFRRGYATSGKTFRVRYMMKYHRMDKDGDFCPIPRRFNEAVIYGVAMRIAEFDTNAVLHKQNQGRFIDKVRQIRKAMNRHLNYSGERWNVPRSTKGVPSGKHLSTPRTTY